MPRRKAKESSRTKAVIEFFFFVSKVQKIWIERITKPTNELLGMSAGLFYQFS